MRFAIAHSHSPNAPLELYHVRHWLARGYGAIFFPMPRLRLFLPRLEKEMAWFLERYDLLTLEMVRPQTKKRLLGTGSPLVCRYCGKDEVEATFKTVSHAFPESIGNSSLIDRLECDACNKLFSKMLDDHLAAWSTIERSAGGTKGKNGIPTVVSPDPVQSVRMEVNTMTRNRTITVKPGAPGFHFDPQSKTVSWTAHQQPYIPLGVFKSFVKMALAVMPDAERVICAHLVSWIQEKSHSLASLEALDLQGRPQAVVSYLAGPVEPNQFWYALLRRKPNREVDCPYMIFVLQFSNVVSQIMLPMPQQDQKLKGRRINLQIFPHPGLDPVHSARYGLASTQIVDLGGTEKTERGITKPMSMGFDDAQELPADEAQEQYRQYLASRGGKRQQPPGPKNEKAPTGADQDTDMPST